MKKFKEKLFLRLLGAGVVTSLMVLPYTFALSPGLIQIFTPPVIAAQVIQTLIIFSAAVFLGIKLADKTGFQMPVWEGVKPVDNLKTIWKPAAGWGVVSGLFIILASLLFSSLSATFLTAEIKVAWWKRILASFYGGIGEEIVMRLFLMTLLVWAWGKIFKTKGGKTGGFGVWFGIIMSAVIFGLGHLGITGTMTSITPLVVLRAVLLNGVPGVIFGCLYWKKGLEAAMIAHFSADIVVHVITPTIASLIIG